MPLTNAERRSLRARANSLKSTAIVGKAGVTPALVEQIRGLFNRNELLKVRVQADASSDVDAIGEALAGQLPCEIVARTGFVLICYRPAEAESA